MANRGEIAGRSGFRPSHPGRIIRDAIAALGVTQEQLAVRIGVSRQTISAIIGGHSAITADIAVRLHHALKVSHGLLLRMQAAHDAWEVERSAVLDIEPFAVGSVSTAAPKVLQAPKSSKAAKSVAASTLPQKTKRK